jgi:hypothetical protein
MRWIIISLSLIVSLPLYSKMHPSQNAPYISASIQKPSSIHIKRPTPKPFWQYILLGALISTLGLALILFSSHLVVTLGLILFGIGYYIILYGMFLFVYRMIKRLRKRLRKTTFS